MRRVLLLLVSLAGLGVFLLASAQGFGGARTHAWIAQAKPESAVRVEVVKPARRSATRPAQVEPLEQVDLVAKLSGFLKSYGKDLDGQEIDTGGRVKSGQVVAVLSVPELEKEVQLKEASCQEAASAAEAAAKRLAQAEKEMGKYQAELRYQAEELSRYEGLFKRASIEKSLLDQKRSAHEAAQAGWESAEARVAQMKADLQVARDHVAVARLDRERVAELLNYATVRAPDRGPEALYLVTRRWADPGDYLQPSGMKARDAIVSLARVDRVKVAVDLPELDAAAVEVGDACTFQASALPGKLFQGKVSRHAAALEPATRTMRVEIDFPNPGGRPLYPGMFGQAVIHLAGKRGLLTLPSRCLHRDGDRSFVYVVSGGKAVKTPVQIGVDDGAATEIVGGLKEDSQVVRTSYGTLSDGAAVAVFEPKK